MYYYTLSKVELHGPTNFSMFLDKAIDMASKPVDQGNQRYYLLLVITVSMTPKFRESDFLIISASPNRDYNSIEIYKAIKIL